MKPTKPMLPLHATALVLAAALAGFTGCGDGSADAGAVNEANSASSIDAPAAEGSTGSIAFSLTAAGGVTFTSFDYVITGPNVTRSGSIDVSKSTTLSARIDSLPVASNYSITLSGRSLAPTEAQCAGSAPFAITAGRLTNVAIPVACHLPNAVVTPPAGAPSVPVPPFAVGLLGVLLMGIGARRRSERARGN